MFSLCKSLKRTMPLLLLLPALLPNFALSQIKQPGTSQATTQPSSTASTTSAVFRGGDSLSTSITGVRAELGPGDLIEISVFDTPELLQRTRVDSNGKIALSLIGEVDVHGLTADALQKTIRDRMTEGRFMKDPQISVLVLEFAGQTASITGEVNRPGAYPLLRAHDLLDLIAVAGGLSPRAGNQATIFHASPDELPDVVDLNDKDRKSRNYEVHAGDSITVAQAGVVYVLGDVGKPGGFLLDRRTSITASQAVALAEGTLTSASIRKARIIRTTDGIRDEIPIDLKLVLRAEGTDPELQAGDILYVPSSLLHGLGRNTIQTALAAAISGLAIYSSYHF